MAIISNPHPRHADFGDIAWMPGEAKGVGPQGLRNYWVARALAVGDLVALDTSAVLKEALDGLSKDEAKEFAAGPVGGFIRSLAKPVVVPAALAEGQ